MTQTLEMLDTLTLPTFTFHSVTGYVESSVGSPLRPYPVPGYSLPLTAEAPTPYRVKPLAYVRLNFSPGLACSVECWAGAWAGYGVGIWPGSRSMPLFILGSRRLVRPPFPSGIPLLCGFEA